MTATTIHDVLDALAAEGVTFDVDRSVNTPLVVFDPPLLPEALTMLGPWMPWLAHVALGRYTRHAPVVCERCGFVSIARVINGRATGTVDAAWRAHGTCPLCTGKRIVVGIPDIRRLTRPRPRLSAVR